MKFCKNLQRVIEISDPAWSPYWLNYKMLKKVIRDLKSGDEKKEAAQDDSKNPAEPSEQAEQQRGDETKESSSTPSGQKSESVEEGTETDDKKSSPIGKSPGEVVFFKLLHAELKKSQHFFDRTSDEVQIRVERVQRGMEMMKEQSIVMVNEKWQPLSKAIYQLYRDLLLLETFAIMTYVGFSKILKKHDKVTGLRTCKAFMERIVNKASFTHYPRLMSMITKCESIYEEISTTLENDGRQALSEDERLFIRMIHRLNEQFLGSDESVAPGRSTKKRKYPTGLNGSGGEGSGDPLDLLANDRKEEAKDGSVKKSSTPKDDAALSATGTAAETTISPPPQKRSKVE